MNYGVFEPSLTADHGKLRVFVVELGRQSTAPSEWLPPSATLVGATRWYPEGDFELSRDVEFDLLAIWCCETTAMIPEVLNKLNSAMANHPSADCGVCLVRSPTCSSSLGLFLAGIDSAVVAGQPSLSATEALYSAYKIGLVRKVMGQRLAELKTTIDHMRTINQATSVMAQRLKISEHSALQRLRKEARDRRRPMHELAQVLLDAAKLLNAGPRDLLESATVGIADVEP